ncbi:MAG: NADP-dependent oxidoreductase [Acidobacteria bacterium]|nr:NADP-dependent oxidoreductase [Acidobacteriota bacterium]
MVNKRVLLASRPVGMPTPENFTITADALETMTAGDVLVQVLYLSLDPYMRGRMSDAKSYAEPFKVGAVLGGGTIGRVVRSNSEKFREGDIVEGQCGWQQYALVPAATLRKVDPRLAPITTALGILGMPGMTAYFGLLDLCKPKAGETVVVSGAAGAVGSYVGQIAKLKGCRVVGIAGTDEKCRLLVEEFGFDAAYNYKTTTDHSAKLKELCPSGIDCYFDNVGGVISDAVFSRMNTFGRVSICGQISQYNNTKVEIGPRLLSTILVKQLKVEGFIVIRYFERAREFYTDMSQWLREGKLKYRDTVVDGIENAPQAFIGLLQGENTGKMLVKVAD